MSTAIPAENGRVDESSQRRRRHRRKEEFSAEQVEAVIATLGGKVRRLQKDIGALKLTADYSTAAPRRTSDVPTKLTESRSNSGPHERKVARFAEGRRDYGGSRREGQSGESKSFSHELATASTANSCEAALSCRAVVANMSTTTTAQEKQRKHALFNAQRKYRPQSQQVDSQSDDDDAECRRESKARSSEAALGARSIHGQRDSGVIRNMDEQTATRRGIDKEQDAGRYAAEINGAPVVKPLTTPHRRANLNEVTDESSAADKPLDRLADRGEPATAASKSNHEKSVKTHEDVGRSNKVVKVTEKRVFATKKTTILAHDKINAPKNDAAAPKARPIANENTPQDLDNKNTKTLKFSEKDRAVKDYSVKAKNISSKLIKFCKTAVKKSRRDKNTSNSSLKLALVEKNQSPAKDTSTKKKSLSRKNQKHLPETQTNKNNSKSSDSVKNRDISMKSKLNNCTKELNQLIGQVSWLFAKKN